MDMSSNNRKSDRRKDEERRKKADPIYRACGKDRRGHHNRRKYLRRKNISALVTCGECRTTFKITREVFHKNIQEGNPLICSRGCGEDNTEAARAALLMVEKAFSPARILIADDDPEICTLLKGYLTEKGYKVFTALCGEDAISIVKKERPHIMLLDIIMPGMGGMEILKEIRNIDKEVHVVIISGVHDEKTAKTIFKFGANDYITKPMDLNYIDSVLLVNTAVMVG